MADVRYRCRKCRFVLFNLDDLSTSHAQREQCPSWYLRNDDQMLPWVNDLIDESGWTEGKLYCPKCKSRIGGFDFLHAVRCACLENVFSAIWCPKSKVDKIVKHEGKSGALRDIDKSDAGPSHTENKLSSNTGSSCLATTDSVVEERNNDSGTSMSEMSSYEPKDVKGSCGLWKDVNRQSKSTAVQRCREKFDCKAVGFQSKETTCLEDDVEPVTGEKPTQETSEYLDGSHFTETRKHGIDGHCSFQHPDGQHTSDEMLSAATSSCCETVGCIYESIKEVRKEVVDLYNCSSNEQFKINDNKKDKRRSRRRGRGKWEHEQEYLAALRDVKRASEVTENQILNTVRPSTQSANTESIEQEFSDSDIPDCYKCAVCLNLLLEPQKTPCLHVFCGICLKQLNHVSRGRPKCPLCREPISKVTPEEVLETELQVSFPVNYRKRVKEARKSRHRNRPLPSPQPNHTSQPGLRPVSQLAVIPLVIAVVVKCLLGNDDDDDDSDESTALQRILLLLIIILACTLFSFILVFLVVYAFDFVKISLLLVCSYFAMTKFALNALLSG